MNKHLKGLNYDPNPKPVKQIKAVQYFAVMVVILVLLCWLDKIGIIKVVGTSGI